MPRKKESHDLDSFCTTLARAARLWRRGADEALHSYNLSDATTTPLWVINREGEGLRQCALAEQLSIEGQSLVRLLDQLEDAGFVSRCSDPTDRRAKTIHLTKAGRSMVKKINGVVAENHARMLGGVTQDEIYTTLKVLNNIIIAVDPSSQTPHNNTSHDIDSFCTTLARAARLWRKAANEALNAYGLSEPTTTPLWVINREGDGLRQCILAEQLGIEGQSLVRLLDQLEDAGLVSRCSDPTDRRAKTIHLTKAGHTMLTKVNKVVDQNHARLLGSVTQVQMRTTLKVFNNIITSIDPPKS